MFNLRKPNGWLAESMMKSVRTNGLVKMTVNEKPKVYVIIQFGEGGKSLEWSIHLEPGAKPIKMSRSQDEKLTKYVTGLVGKMQKY